MKKYFTLLGVSIIFLFCLQMDAQAVDSLDVYYQNEEWEKGIHYGEKKIIDFENFQNEKEYTKLLKQVAYLYLSNGNFLKAEENLLKSYEILENTYLNDIEYFINETEEIALFYKSVNNLSKADYFAQKGYDLTINTNFEKKYLSFLSLKASIKNDLGDIESAYILYLESLLSDKKEAKKMASLNES